MALLTFPLPLTEFFNGLPIEESMFDLGEAVEFEETEGGNFYTVEYGEQLWAGSFQVRAENPHQADRLAARIGLLRRAGTSFFVSYKHRVGPIADPHGTLLGASTPTISNLASNNREMSITGLPAGYVLTEGDRFTFTYGSPTKYALHRIMTTIAANGAGQATNIEVSPPIRPGAATGRDVILKNPFCEARIKPGSYQPQRSRSGRTYGFSAEWGQVL